LNFFIPFGGSAMKKVRSHLLATAAVVALGGTAYAADMGLPMKAPPAPAPIPYATWQGFYVGGLVGVGRLNETNTVSSDTGAHVAGIQSTCGNYASTCSHAATGAIAGVEVGYDWQSRYFVYGVVADWTWAGLHSSSGQTSGATVWRHEAKVDWLASFRGRMGLAVDDTLVYFTGGLALGHLKSSGSSADADGPISNVALNNTKVGWVAGLGVEHKFTPNWSGKAEFLYYDLGRASQNFRATEPATSTYTSTFTHEVFVGRVGIAYHF
jgi:outer membrane immunogenic protein